MDAIIVVSIIVGIGIDAFIAYQFSNIAAMKGHDSGKYFWCCFLLGIIGYLMVFALPDVSRDVSRRNSRGWHNLPKLEVEERVVKKGDWFCKSCGDRNSANTICCKACGAYK